MDKLKMQSLNKVDDNIAKIGKLFPNCVTEVLKDGKETLAVDFDMLKQELSNFVVEGREERYQFTWPDKRKSILMANSPINKTLRPVVTDETIPTGSDSIGKPYMSTGSVGKDGTAGVFDSENLYIEGDNLEVLKLLQEAYMGKIKMIYIDPPYNTGDDFVYEDDFAMSSEEYAEISNQTDEDGNRLFQNNDSNGRFHTDWLNMIYPRLNIAKDLLTDDGVVFISIDDNEVHNLRKLCDEVFGTNNFVSEIFIASNSSKNNSKHISISHEYLLCYAKEKNNMNHEWKVKKNQADEFEKRAKSLLDLGFTFEQIHKELLILSKYPRFYDFDHYTYVDENGVFRAGDAGGVTKGNFFTEIVHPITKKPCAKPSGGWRYKHEEMQKLLNSNMFYFGENESGIPQIKRYLKDYMFQVPKSLMFFDSQSSTKWLKSNGIPFDFAKSIELIKHILSIFSKDALVLDFFSGSATTAHAVMQLNAEDGGNRKFICVQLPENLDENLKHATGNSKKTIENALDFCKISQCSHTLSEIGKERIRRAGKQILEKFAGVSDKTLGVSNESQATFFDNLESETQNQKPTLDIGFRVLKVDSSNMKDVYYNPQEMQQTFFDKMVNNIKEDRTPQDLLLQVMLDMGVMLDRKITESIVVDKKIFIVGENIVGVSPNLVACFDDNLTDEVVTAIAKMKPLYAVFRDSSFASDSVAANFEQIFNTYSPTTVRSAI